MKKQLMLLLGMLSLLIPAGFVISGSANAEPDPMVVVCKYVGTPGGEFHHVIVVSENTLNNVEGVNGEAYVSGQFPFAWVDAHGQTQEGSIAIGFEGEVTGADCPGNESPPTCPEDSEVNPGEVIPDGETEESFCNENEEPPTCPEDSEINAGLPIPEGETVASYCFEEDQEPPVCPDDSEINAGEVIPDGQTAEEFCFIDVQGEQTCPTDSEINAGEVIPEGETVRSFCNEDNRRPNPPNPPNPQGEQETPEVAGEQARAPVAPAVEVPTTVDSGL